jgi:DUF4097 and DUF4098 domain-containing protein YvlB
MPMFRSLSLAAMLAIIALPSFAQPGNQRSSRPAIRCEDGSSSDRASYCEIREDTIPGLNPLDIDASPNGGIRLRGWDRNDVLIRTKITAYGDSEAAARRIASGVRVETAGGRIRADGPPNGRDESWSASFEIQVPRTALVTLATHNGGISIDDFRGTAKFRAQNGGVRLSNVGGDIRGETTNGGVNVDVTGDRWDGAGLDVETRNGGIRLTLPANYSAELETGTTNGRISIDFPITVTGSLRRHVTTTLGAGGARIRAVTTNGGILIRRF